MDHACDDRGARRWERVLGRFLRKQSRVHNFVSCLGSLGYSWIFLAGWEWRSGDLLGVWIGTGSLGVIALADLLVVWQ